VVVIVTSGSMRSMSINLKKREKRLLQRIWVWPTEKTIGKAEINFTIAESRGFLYRKAREATETVIGRCELFPSVVDKAILNVWGGR